MYRCDVCRVNVQPKTPCHKIAVQTKKVLHPERLRAKKGMVVQKNGKKKVTWLPDPGGWGTQIVAEAKMCPCCAGIWKENQRQKALATSTH